jgi:hypothetical protein
MSRRDFIRAKIMGRVQEEPAPAWLNPLLGPCQIWQGPHSGNGRGGDYPRMNLDGATVAVHIANWTNEHGLIPPRKQLDHLCRRRRCIAEPHLELVTHKENQKRRDLARFASPFECQSVALN